jgi:tight adherence protein B
MTGAQLAAGAGGATAVLAAWEAIGVIQAAEPARRIGVLLAPLRGGSGTGGQDVSAAERRRLVMLLAATLFGAGWLLAGPAAALAASTAGPWLVGRAIAVRHRRWRRAMGEGAPVAARAMADALAGGHSVRGALAEASTAGGGGDAVDAELRRAAAALALGARTERVLDGLRAAADGPAWDTIVAAILLQREAGGDLAALLRELAGELEAARRVEADARAATAQARFTAGTVAVLPIFAAGLAELAAPGTLAAIAGNPIALVLAAVAVVLQAAGLVVVRRLARALEV